MATPSVCIEDDEDNLPAYFTWGTARELGLTRRRLEELLAERRVRRVLRDVYVRSGLPDDVDTRLEAARLILPPHAVVVDRTAAWLWGVDTFDLWELDFVPRVDVFVLRGHKPITREAVGGGSRDLKRRDVQEWRGLAVTTPLRTALDLACFLPRYNALAAVDALCRMHDIEPQDLANELRRFRGRRGVVQAREIVGLADPAAESSGESFTRCIIVDDGLPVPESQVWVLQRGVPVYRLDLAYPRLKICIEYDGERYHSSPEDREADRQRRTWLREQGWHVIVVDKTSLKTGAREVWLRELREVLRERTAPHRRSRRLRAV